MLALFRQCDRHDIAEIVLKVALNTKHQSNHRQCDTLLLCFNTPFGWVLPCSIYVIFLNRGGRSFGGEMVKAHNDSLWYSTGCYNIQILSNEMTHKKYQTLKIDTISTHIIWFSLVLWCLTPHLTIFQLYRGGQCYWWRKPEYPEKATYLAQVTDKLFTHNVVSRTPRLIGIRTYNVSGDMYRLHTCKQL